MLNNLSAKSALGYVIFFIFEIKQHITYGCSHFISFFLNKNKIRFNSIDIVNH